MVLPSSFYILENFIYSSDLYWTAFFPLTLIYAFSIALYAPTAKILAEAFPTRIRGLGISIPYHLGNGIFGGAVSIFGALQLQNFSGPWFTVTYTIFSLVVGLVILSSQTQKEAT